jgi:hypothetical protein
MFNQPETPSGSTTNDSPCSFKQVKGNIPTDVLNMYLKKQRQTPKAKVLHQKKDAEAKLGKRIDDFFGKRGNSRSTVHDKNRLTNDAITECSSSSIDNNPQDDLDKVMTEALTQAKEISQEYEKILECEEVDIKHAFKVMGKMYHTLLELMQQLQTSMASRNRACIESFNEKLKICTSFISKEINHVRKEIREIKENDIAECTNTIQSCNNDLKKLWIRFVYESDAEDMRNEKNPSRIKEALMQMNIPIGTMKFPIESFYYQTKRFGDGQLFPEVALCCTFVNSTIASIVKNGVRKFNSNLKASGNSHLIRYHVASELSFNVRSLLKICNEMKNFNVIAKVFVTNEGIKVYHDELTGKNDRGKEYKYSSSFVNSFRKLDQLRRQLGDHNSTVPAANVYSSEYFGLSYEEKKKVREDVDKLMDLEEYEISDSEEMEKSIANTHQ